MYDEPYPPPPPPPDNHDPSLDNYNRPPPRRRPGKRNSVKAAAVLIALLLILLALFLPIYDGQSLADKILGDYNLGFGDNLPEYADIEMVRTIDVSISGGYIEYSIDIPLPGDIDASGGAPIQIVSDYGTSPPASVTEKYGAQWLTWSGTTNRDFTVQISYSIRSYTAQWNLARSDAGEVSDIPSDLDYLLDDEWLIEPSSYQVRTLAQDLTAGMTNVYDMVKAIYDYMDDEYTYTTGREGGPQSCSQTISSKSGDCDDQSILLSSLLRAVGIPAWLEFGALYDPSTGEFGAHGWVNVYIPLAGGEGGSGTIDMVNDEFLVRDPMRFTEWESDGNADHLEDYYATMDYTYSSPDISVALEDSYSGTYSPSD